MIAHSQSKCNVNIAREKTPALVLKVLMCICDLFGNSTFEAKFDIAVTKFCNMPFCPMTKLAYLARNQLFAVQQEDKLNP